MLGKNTVVTVGHGAKFSREYTVRNWDSERISVVYRCRTDGVL